MRPLLLTVLFAAAPGLADVVSYEGFLFPDEDEDAWLRYAYCTPERWLQDGWFHQEVQPGECHSPPEGDQDNYSRSIAEFDGASAFFLEWSILAEGESSEFPWGAPAVIAAGNQGGEAYWFGVARDEVLFYRDSFAEIVTITIEPNIPHNHRLEVYSDQLYVWMIDGAVVHSNTPGGPYPSANPGIAWRARSAYLTSVVHWDYIRFGNIPVDASGDFDSSMSVDSFDHYYFLECLSSLSGSWAGCAWADMDSDGSTTCDDWELFLAAWTAPDDPPMVVECMCGLADLNDSNAVDAADLAQLLGAWGPNPNNPADFNSNDTVNASDLAILLGAWGQCK